MSFKIASKKAQNALRRIVPRHLGDFDETPSELEYFENLKSICTRTQKTLTEMKLRGIGKEDANYRAVAMEFRGASTKIKEIKDKLNGNPRVIKDLLLNIIRDEVSEDQWRMWFHKAKLAEKRQKAEIESTLNLNQPSPDSVTKPNEGEG